MCFFFDLLFLFFLFVSFFFVFLFFVFFCFVFFVSYDVFLIESLLKLTSEQSLGKFAMYFFLIFYGFGCFFI